MDITKLNGHIGINYDFILALKKHGAKVEVIKIPIKRRLNKIEALIKMVDNSIFDVTDMYGVMTSLFSSYPEEFNLCFGYACDDVFYGKLEFPVIDTKSYLGTLSKEENRIEILNKRGNKRLANQLQQKLLDKIHNDKMDYLDKALSYIAADDYTRAVENIRDNKNYVAYSNEVHGWYRPIHKVNDDISVQIKTNFCFGNSTKFLVIVRYKDIAILPYGEWVSYYYAKIDQLIGCTRTYQLNRERWFDCMNFLCDFINAAIDDPYNFVKKEIMTEVNTLINGLEEIFDMDSNCLEHELRVQRSKTESRYIGIRSAYVASDKDIEKYKISPDETTMIYRMEKICLALKFLDSLREIKDIYDDVNSAIEKIIKLNLEIKPEVDAAIPPVKEEIKVLENELAPKTKRLDFLENKIDKFEERLDKLCDKATSSEQKEEITVRFKASHPLYEQYTNEAERLYDETRSLKSKISDRESLLNRLNNYKELIEKYTED
jgi:hypothetical protein